MLAWDQLRPVVLGLIGEGKTVASELRDRLSAAGVSLTPLAFQGMLAALERTGLVSGRFSKEVAAEIAAESRCYRLTAAGRAELIASAQAERREAA